MRSSLIVVALAGCHDAPAPILPDASADAVVATACPAGAPLGVLGAKPTVPVMIGGKGPFTFIYDTGAPLTYLDNALRAQLGGPPYTFEVGGRTMSAGALPAIDVAQAIGTQGAQGILGTDLLGSSAVTIDRRRMKFWIGDTTDEAALAACEHAGAPVIVDLVIAEYLYVRGREQGIDGWFLVDTGATLGAVNRPVFDQFPARPALTGFYTPAAIGTFWAKLATVDAMEVVAMHVDHLAVRTVPEGVLPAPPPDSMPFIGLLPNGFLHHALVTVDYPARRLRLAPYRDDVPLEPTFAYTIGIGLAEETTTPPHVGVVLAGSAAATAGVHVGDQVLAVNGAAIDQIPLASRQWALMAQGPATITVRIRDGAGTRDLALTASDLL